MNVVWNCRSFWSPVRLGLKALPPLGYDIAEAGITGMPGFGMALLMVFWVITMLEFLTMKLLPWPTLSFIRGWFATSRDWMFARVTISAVIFELLLFIL